MRDLNEWHVFEMIMKVSKMRDLNEWHVFEMIILSRSNGY